MTFFKRMFSADFRRAVAAEAAGEYAEAARAYALAGEHAKVAEMHLLRAERAPSPEGKLHELRAAVRWADPDEPEGRAMRRRVARALFNWARQAGVLSDADKQVVREAAALFAEAGDHAGAGECHEFIGDELQAAEAYQRAGDVDRLETVLHREETRRKHLHRVSDAWEEYRLHLAGGERDRAVSALRACVDASRGEEQAGYRRALEQLEAKLLESGKVTLRDGGRETTYVGVFPLVIGREPVCHLVLRDAGISRRHCEIRLEDGGFQVRDLDSKNGTTLAGVRIAGALPLHGEGELGVGELCAMRYRALPGALELELVRGLDRGLRVHASAGPIAIADAAELSFVDGRPRLRARAGASLDLNGVHAGGEVQLIRGDVVDVRGPATARLEVA